MDALRNSIRNCNKCPLRANVPILPVPGQGLQTARIFLVKDRITYEEAKMDLNLLVTHDSYIKAFFKELGVDERDLYISSAVKCNCTVHRNTYTNQWNKSTYTTEHEIGQPVAANYNACIDWLKDEINMVNPKVLACFGSKIAKVLKKKIPDREFIELPAIDRMMSRNKGYLRSLKELAKLITALKDNELLFG